MNKVKGTIIAVVLIGFVFAGVSMTEGAIPKKKNNSVQMTKREGKRISGTKHSSKVAKPKGHNSGKSVIRNNGVLPKKRNTLSSISKAKPMPKVQNKPSLHPKALKAEKNEPLSRKETKGKQQMVSKSGSGHSSKGLENGLKEGLKDGLKYGLKYGLKEGEKN